jgi:hypothetical protein
VDLGFTPEKFHKICDNKPRTVTIIKAKESGEILEGYNPIVWETEYGDFGETKDSFIFSFKDGIENYILSRVDNEKFAVYYDDEFGPSFGCDDLAFYGDNGYCMKHSYEKPIRIDYFNAEEYEVFQVIKD